MEGPKEYKSPIIEKISRSTPLKVSFTSSIIMRDERNWKDGEYIGNWFKVEQEVNWLIKKVEDWLHNGQSGDTERLVIDEKYKNKDDNGKENA